MIRDVAGQSTPVIVYRVDRLTRRLRDLLELTEPKRGIALVSITEAFDTAAPAARAAEAIDERPWTRRLGLPSA